MLTYALLYMIIAFAFISGFYLHDNDTDDNKKAKAAIIAFSFGWPLTSILLVVLIIWAKYQNLYKDKINRIVKKYEMELDWYDNKELINKLSIRELELFAFANRIEAYKLTDKDKELVQRLLVDKSFEQTILEK